MAMAETMLTLLWSYGKCFPSNSAIVPLKVVLFELKTSFTAFTVSLVYIVHHRRFCNVGEDERGFP